MRYISRNSTDSIEKEKGKLVFTQAIGGSLNGRYNVEHGEKTVRYEMERE